MKIKTIILLHFLFQGKQKQTKQHKSLYMMDHLLLQLLTMTDLHFESSVVEVHMCSVIWALNSMVSSNNFLTLKRYKPKILVKFILCGCYGNK